MHTGTIAAMPWTRESSHYRSSFSSRISGFFGRKNESVDTYQSPRATTTFEVPLFLSPTRYDPRSDREQNESLRSGSQRSTPQDGSVADCIQPSRTRSSSVYSGSHGSQILVGMAAAASSSQTATQVSNSSRSERVKRSKPTRKRQPQQKRRRKISLKRQLQTAKHLSLAFGVTFLLAVVTYLVLAATGIASGMIFHVIFVLLLLVLFGVFLHSSIRWIIFSRRRKEKRRQRIARGQWFGHAETDIERVAGRELYGALDGDISPDQPIQIVMKEDEVTDGALYGSRTKLQHPPPTYGNLRESKRIDPSLVHWKQVPPSPLTPTYAEAMNDVQRVVGYRPPSYAETDCGATQIIETQRRDVDGSLEHIHPLHRNSAGH